jgi:hypothetical protein
MTIYYVLLADETSFAEKEEEKFAQNCLELKSNGISESGVYTIKPSLSGGTLEVFCDMDTAGGGWTVSETLHFEFHHNHLKMFKGFPTSQGWLPKLFCRMGSVCCWIWRLAWRILAW